MYKKNNKTVLRLTAVVLLFALALPVCSNAEAIPTVQPRASDYLNSYNAYVYPAGNGKLQVWFSVTGTDVMDYLGCMNIHIYESTDQTNWTWIKAFNYNNNPSMMGTNYWYHSGYVEHQVTPGRYYRAYVCIYAGIGNQGDSRYFYTSAKLAT